MKKQDLLTLAQEAIELSKLQQKQRQNWRQDNGKRNTHELFNNNLFWMLPGIIVHQLGILVQVLITASSEEQKRERRLKFLSVVFTFIDRFCGLPTEPVELVDGKSIIEDRGTL
jgi:hypothetical protein